MFTSSNYKLNDKCVTKGTLATVLISIFLSTLCLTVITASDNDTRLVEILPSLLGGVVFFGSVYLINLIKSQLRKIINELNLNRRSSVRKPSVGSALAALDRELHRKHKYSLNTGVNSIIKLHITTYYYYLYYLRVLIRVSTAEICLFILEAKDSKDIFYSPIFWINSLILPPPVLISKWLLFPDLSYLQVYWIHGFIIWIKLFSIIQSYNYIHLYIFTIWINNRIIQTKDGSEKAKCIFRISLGIFFMSCSFAGSIFIMQGCHPFEGNSQYSYSFAQYLNYFYLAIITFSTVGYGDMIPLTVEARMCAICYIFWMVIWVPLTINRTLEIVLAKNILSGHLTSWYSIQSTFLIFILFFRAGLKKFVLVIGDVDPAQLSQFISKMYYTKDKCKIIVLTPNDIEVYTTQIKQADNLSISLCIMRGDIEVDGHLGILDMIQAKLATSIFILSSFKGSDLRLNDMKTIVRTIGIKKYGCRSENVMVQYCSPITHSIFQSPFGVEISLNDLKLSLVTKSITCPGIVTLIVNLSLNQYYNIGNTQNNYVNSKSIALYQSYLSGAEKSVCFHKIPNSCQGILFEVSILNYYSTYYLTISLCDTFFNSNGVILIGIISIDDPLSYKINPTGTEYYIKKGDTGIFILDFDSCPDLSQMSTKNSALIRRNTILLKLIKNGDLEIDKGTGSDLSTLTYDPEDNSEPTGDEIYRIEPTIIIPNPTINEEYDTSFSIFVKNLTYARENVFRNKDLPIITILGFTDFVIKLLYHFSTINQFNVIIAGNSVYHIYTLYIFTYTYRHYPITHSIILITLLLIVNKINIELLNQFKSFVAIIEVDLMKYTDIISSELHLSTFFYITPNPVDLKLENNADLSTIVVFRQIRNLLKTIRKVNYQGICNIFGLVELQNLNNVTFLDDSKWSQWNVYNESVDSSLIYINSQEYAMGQIISDELFYNVIIGSFSSSENYMFYNIMMDLISIPSSRRKNRGVELFKLSDLNLKPGKYTFSGVFNYVLQEMQSILIGLFRMYFINLFNYTNAINLFNYYGVSMENYVICSPEPDFELLENDMVFIYLIYFIKFINLFVNLMYRFI
ncbi:uncharacterized protein TA08325 [Theileria annulata]|uniref:Uncharacterized protein n=1 Tax=Theileria annulata TaxID=5874 RepID=Q4U9P7_THEAN|nr:uncharacterized protein TA08325 [Theileria annulata]CAI76456.1 hypothetical protein, conserved [Theileria annulata]|eukprot:XP_953081.1 hypothetical protein, conserved [Theileria annulata]